MLRSKEDKAVASICDVWFIFIYHKHLLTSTFTFLANLFGPCLALRIVGCFNQCFSVLPPLSTMFARFCRPKVLLHMEAASWTLKLGDFTAWCLDHWSTGWYWWKFDEHIFRDPYHHVDLGKGAGHVLGSGSLRQSIVDVVDVHWHRAFCFVSCFVSCFGSRSVPQQGCQNDKDIPSFHAFLVFLQHQTTMGKSLSSVFSSWMSQDQSRL